MAPTCLEIDLPSHLKICNSNASSPYFLIFKTAVQIV